MGCCSARCCCSKGWRWSSSARYASASAEFTRRLVIMLVAGAVATSFLTLAAAADEFARTRGSAISLIDFFSRGRWSGHIADVNAAGSVLCHDGILALGVGFADRKWRPAWLVSGVVLFLAMLMTGSRTAVAAAGLVAIVFSCGLRLHTPAMPSAPPALQAQCLPLALPFSWYSHRRHPLSSSEFAGCFFKPPPECCWQIRLLESASASTACGRDILGRRRCYKSGDPIMRITTSLRSRRARTHRPRPRFWSSSPHRS